MNSFLKKTLTIAHGYVVFFCLCGAFFATFATPPVFAQQSQLIGVPVPVVIAATTPEKLREKYMRAGDGGAKIKILIVPGHEPGFGGTVYNTLKEREFVVDLAENLTRNFAKNPRFEIVVSRTDDAWNPLLGNYFDTQMADIAAFAKSHRELMDAQIKEGTMVKYQSPPHGGAPPDVALRLYGMNKWSNENGVDLMLHLHFNDYPRKKWKQPGKYNGFTIYTPEKSFANARASFPVAESVYQRLERFFAVSNLATESAGVVEDQDLIALGGKNSSDAASILIEYGYIYEPQITRAAVRPAMLKEYAWQTFVGVENFFEEKFITTRATSTVLLHTWKTAFSEKSLKGAASVDVLALQMAMTLSGVYPPADKTKNECVTSGIFGPCTRRGLASFQKKYGIKGEADVVGTKTRAKLNRFYGSLSVKK